MGNTVVNNTADRVLIIIERNKSIIAPGFTKNLSTVEGIFVFYSADGFAGSYTIRIVSILNIIKGFKLTSLFPNEIMTEVADGVTLYVVNNGLAVIRSEQVFPGFCTLVFKLYSFLLKMSIERTILEI